MENDQDDGDDDEQVGRMRHTSPRKVNIISTEKTMSDRIKNAVVRYHKESNLSMAARRIEVQRKKKERELSLPPRVPTKQISYNGKLG